jgi:hypothetical protein
MGFTFATTPNSENDFCHALLQGDGPALITATMTAHSLLYGLAVT